MNNFQNFVKSIIVEALHPELKSIVHDTTKKYGTSKQAQLAKKIKELSVRGESTGIEGNMPKGSSRAYLAHADRHKLTVDGVDTHMKTGIKVAIRSPLDKHHDHTKYDGRSLGRLQNEAEGGDHFVNSSYRTLRHVGGRDDEHKFETNEHGIFPPLLEHDHSNHEWTHVGHVDNVNPAGFMKHTKTKEYPEGISHGMFCAALNRRWDMDRGKHWKGSPEHEARLDHVEQHPLVQTFLDHQGNTATPPHDYSQIKNMGVWTHPVHGTKHIVARDHGFNTETMNAYDEAHKKKYR